MKRLGRIAWLYLAFGILFCCFARSQQPSAPATNMPPLTGLTPDHATLSVGDIQRESAWYQGVLGFRMSQSFTNPAGFPIQILTIPGYRIDLVQHKGSTKPTYTNPREMTQGWVHIVFNVSDIGAAYKTLENLKADVDATKDNKGTIDHMMVHDPEGNEIEIFRRQ